MFESTGDGVFEFGKICQNDVKNVEKHIQCAICNKLPPIVKNVMQNSPIVGNGVGTIVGDGDGTGVGSAQGQAINRGTEGRTPSLLFQMFSDLLMMFMTLN